MCVDTRGNATWTINELRSSKEIKVNHQTPTGQVDEPTKVIIKSNRIYYYKGSRLLRTENFDMAASNMVTNHARNFRNNRGGAMNHFINDAKAKGGTVTTLGNGYKAVKLRDSQSRHTTVTVIDPSRNVVVDGELYDPSGKLLSRTLYKYKQSGSDFLPEKAYTLSYEKGPISGLDYVSETTLIYNSFSYND